MSLIVWRGENQRLRQGLGDRVRGTRTLTTAANDITIAVNRLVLKYLRNRRGACCLPTHCRQELARQAAAALRRESLATHCSHGVALDLERGTLEVNNLEFLQVGVPIDEQNPFGPTGMRLKLFWWVSVQCIRPLD